MSHRPRMYIAGPMAGYEGNNFEAFSAACKHLRDVHPQVEFVSPHEIEHANPEDYCAVMKADFRVLLTCDSIVLLDEWHQSKGAMQELSLARWSGMKVFRYNTTEGLTRA